MDSEIKFEIQKKFKEIGKCRYDFYLTDYNVIIEPDGWQHFRVRTTEKALVNTQKYDREKNLFCLSKNIPILRIPPIYNPEKKEDRVKEIIFNFIKTKQVPEKIIEFYRKQENNNYADIATKLNEIVEKEKN